MVSSIKSARGVGIDQGLKILEKISKSFSVPTITDIHEHHQADAVAQVASGGVEAAVGVGGSRGPRAAEARAPGDGGGIFEATAEGIERA